MKPAFRLGLTVLLPLAALTLWLPVAGASPPASATGASGPARLVLPAMDARGATDPLAIFNAWRMKNRVSLPVPPYVAEAHREWLAASAPAGAGGPASAPAESAVPNVDPAGGVTDYQGETAVAVNPKNPLQLVAMANTFYQDPNPACQAPVSTTYGTMTLYGSKDGGATWTYNCAPWPSDATGSVSGAAAMFGSDPAVAWDGSGNAYASYMLISMNSKGTSLSSCIVTAKSADAGATWQPLGVVVNNLSNASLFDDKPLMAVDTTTGKPYSHPGRIYVIWDENNVERVAYSDTGLTGSWTTVLVDSPNQSNIGGDIAVGADGTVCAIWNELFGTTTETGESIVFSASTDGGATWSAPVTVASTALLSFGSGSTANEYPPAQDQRGVNAFGSLAVDTCPTSPHVGTLYVTYCDFPAGTDSGTDLNTYVVRSTNGGSTWSLPVLVNDDGGTATQFFPWCAVDPSNGSLNVSWYDTRNDPADRRTDVYYAVSTDGGASFGANRQVTSPSADFYNSAITYSDENSTDNPNYNGNQYGDYSGIAAAAGKAFVVWTDSRQFYPASSPGSSLLIEDLAFAAVPQSPSGCDLQCSVTAPGAGAPGVPVAFTATATTTGCTGTPSYDWDFGDGSAHGSGPSVVHTYASPGTYAWSLTVAVSGQSLNRAGSLTIVNPPVVSGVKKAVSPFRFIVTGSNLQSGIQLTINGASWTNLVWKNTGKVVVKGGAALKAAVPKGVPTPFTFTNPDGGTTTHTVTW